MTREIVTLIELTEQGITLAELNRICPLAVEYGPADAPYWKVKDLTPLLGPDGGEA